MHADLAVENPEDSKRRLLQKAVLEREAAMLSTKDLGEDNDLDEEDEGDEDGNGIKVRGSFFPLCSMLNFLFV